MSYNESMKITLTPYDAYLTNVKWVAEFPGENPGERHKGYGATKEEAIEALRVGWLEHKQRSQRAAELAALTEVIEVDW